MVFWISLLLLLLSTNLSPDIKPVQTLKTWISYVTSTIPHWKNLWFLTTLRINPKLLGPDKSPWSDLPRVSFYIWSSGHQTWTCRVLSCCGGPIVVVVASAWKTFTSTLGINSSSHLRISTTISPAQYSCPWVPVSSLLSNHSINSAPLFPLKTTQSHSINILCVYFCLPTWKYKLLRMRNVVSPFSNLEYLLNNLEN